MPTSVQIIPTAGHAPFPTQGGVGASPGFDAIDYRRFWTRDYAEGVVSGAAWKVSEALAGPNLTVEVAADVDPAYVQGDDVADQGLYYVAPHSGVISLDVPAPDVTNPRVDLVVLKVYDDAHDASGFTKADVEIVEGTPTAGADLTNLAGAPAVPNTALPLCYYVATAGATAVSNADILDMRAYGLKDGVVGELRAFAQATIPDGWQEANHGQLRRDVHARLFAAISTDHGAGDGSTTFNKPDMVDRVPVGRSGTRPLASQGGEATHLLTAAESGLRGHGHPAPGGGVLYHSFGFTGLFLRTTQEGDARNIGVDAQVADVGNLDAAAAHENMQPYTAVVWAVFTGSVAG